MKIPIVPTNYIQNLMFRVPKEQCFFFGILLMSGECLAVSNSTKNNRIRDISPCSCMKFNINILPWANFAASCMVLWLHINRFMRLE
jgi:hypothetical protein